MSTRSVLDELLVAIKTHIGVLYRCSEVVALLDTLAGFAHIVISGSGYVRPEFTDTLAIKDGRHPILGQRDAHRTLSRASRVTL